MRTTAVAFWSRFLRCAYDSVHDGWGVAVTPGQDGNAIEAGDTTNMDTIAKNHSYRTLLASGTAVGLSEGLMGNSEVGYVILLAIPFAAKNDFTFQASQHWCWPRCLAGYCPHRYVYQEEAIPQEPYHPPGLQPCQRRYREIAFARSGMLVVISP